MIRYFILGVVFGWLIDQIWTWQVILGNYLYLNHPNWTFLRAIWWSSQEWEEIDKKRNRKGVNL